MFGGENFLSDWIVPLSKPRPDIERFLAAMSGDKVPDRAPLVEYLIDNAVMRPILENMMGRKWVDTSDKTEYMGGQMDFSAANLEIINAWLDNQIAFWHYLGYDFIRVEVSLPLPAKALVVGDTAAGNLDHNRAWQGLQDGPIKSWEDFETYPWPAVSEKNFYIHRYICDHLPEGMGFLSCHAGGVYEHVSRLIGYENLCLFLYDQPNLVRAVTDRLGGLIERYNDHLLELNGLAAIFQGEDFGYNTQTLISPAHIREYFLPWHKKYAAQAHRAGKKYYFHSCGKIDEIMDDLIDGVGIDAKHSFQDGVSPIGEAKERWGGRIALLGGVDVNKLASLPPMELRRYVRRVIAIGSPGGRFAVGAGNSIPSYIPVENYLTLLDEALR
jgi:uroporphyrinogen decarboxylase